MKSKKAKLILSVTVLVILCGSYVCVKTLVHDPEETEGDTVDETEVIYSTDVDKIESVDFIIDDQPVTFVKDSDGSWYYQQDSDFPVNQTAVEELAESFEKLSSQRTLSDVEDIEQYGLDDPQNVITVKTEDDESFCIEIGEENDSVSAFYVKQVDDDKNVYLISSSVIDPFIKNLYDFAQMEEFPFVNSTDINQIKVESENEEGYLLTKNESDGFWYVSGDDLDDKADSAKASGIASQVGSLTYSSMADYDSDNPGEYGLDDPYAVITVDYEETEEVEDTTEQAEDDAAEELETAEELPMNEESTDPEESVEWEELPIEEMTELEESEESEELPIEEELTELEESEEWEELPIEEELTELEESEEWEELPMEEGLTELEESEKSDGTAIEENLTEIEEFDELPDEEVSESENDQEEIREKTVQKQLVLYVGDEAGDDSRYVCLEDSKTVYTMSVESLSSITDNKPADLLDLNITSYSLSRIDQLQIETADTDNVINVSRETSETEDGEEKTTTTYYLNDEELEDTIKLTTFYNKIVNMSASSILMEEADIKDSPKMTLTFKLIDDTKKVKAEYYSYDENYDLVVVNEKKFLVNKTTVKDMIQAYEEFVEGDEES